MSEDIANDSQVFYQILNTVYREALDSGGIEEHHFYHVYDVVFGYLNSLPVHRTGGKQLSTAPQPTFSRPKCKAADESGGDDEFKPVLEVQRIPRLSPKNLRRRGDSPDLMARGPASEHLRSHSPNFESSGGTDAPSYIEFRDGIPEERMGFNADPSTIEKRKRSDSDTRSAISDEPDYQLADTSTDTDVSEIPIDEEKMKRTPDFALFLHTVSESSMYPVLAVECKPLLRQHCYPATTQALIPTVKASVYDFFTVNSPSGIITVDRAVFIIQDTIKQAFSQCECIFNEFEVERIKFIFTVGLSFYACDVTKADMEAKKIKSIPLPLKDDIHFLFAQPAPGDTMFTALNPKLMAIWDDIRKY
ncbi:hypothetical protein DFP72DRAFT_1167810 [Ephemerocybe angulata]|uniref:Uncharacterized protein n=1 Tax=Ephemerocybe angulata TaxID=980116 RepID=A0A8H6I5W7_9AGAR|nr:hypothetical protein DFP72DRAFT_1167810 [Tulosesus angulatus]